MATTEQLMAQYGVAWFDFDEASGDIYDKVGLGGYVGTITGVTRVLGWDGEGNSISFNGTDSKVDTNVIMNITSFTYRMKIKIPSNGGGYVLTVGRQSPTNTDNIIGYGLGISKANGTITVPYWLENASAISLITGSKDLRDNKWHDVLFTQDGRVVKIYVDDELEGSYTHTADIKSPKNPVRLGYVNVPTFENWYGGQLDDLQIYNRALSPSDFEQKRLAIKAVDGKVLTALADRIRELPDMSEPNMLSYGRVVREIDSAIDSAPLSLLKTYTQYEIIGLDGSSVINTINPTNLQQVLGDSPQVIYYTDSGAKDIVVQGNTEPFSVYDYIGELPEVVAYSETEDDISISTNVEPFSIYDEFKDEIEVLYYTNSVETTGANTIIDANWNPIDELEDTFDIVSWTDEADASRVLELNAIPKPQFLYPTDLPSFQNGVSKLLATDNSIYAKQSPVRFLLTSDNNTWYTWKNGVFVAIALTHDNILTQGITSEQLTLITEDQLTIWPSEKVNIGVYLYDSAREVFQSKVQDVGYETQLYSQTSKIEDINLYILNTTATIQIQLDGLTLTGRVDDEDMTRVQYRVLLNDIPYYPETGEFTPLSAPPLNIDLTLRSDEIKINDWNTIKVEFKDSFGTVDYWEADFLGRYAGLMFTNETGEYYSTDLGQVLQYLDFGQILTGQISVTHEVIVENTYGYDLTDVNIAVNTNQFAKGLHVQLGNTEENVQEVPKISLGDMADTTKKSFFIRLASDVNAIPNNSTTFNIIATANRNIVREN